MLKKNKKSAKFNFDGCPVCRAMKNAADRGKALSLDELRAAFDEANGKKKK